MENILKQKIKGEGSTQGIASYCTANALVIEALLFHAKETQQPVLIEATANQVNQYGGYTGMTPQNFADFVFHIADQMGCSRNLIYLGGDHLGPLTFRNLPEEEAMEKARVLVREYVEAGFTKIHLDTSMKLGSDAKDQPLSTEIVAKRGAALYQVCMETLGQIDSDVEPVFIIGSEVPIPGGATEAEEGISVTRVTDFIDTVETYRRVFDGYGLLDTWANIVAVVVQPGVEFGDSQVFPYQREEAKDLCNSLKAYPSLVFEGHSTDYQTKEKLREMVEDGIAILKVGPALTFRLREALFSLSFMEKELIPIEKHACFIEVLEEIMLAEPENWIHHYHGTDEEIALARKYSYSDRCRYYLSNDKVQKAIDELFHNFDEIAIPLNLMHQYMPNQYEKVVRGELKNEARLLVYDAVLEVVDTYEYAINR
ncbi:class II D-tagatose-bisphosphate aldolase, non-catalytic subunit [Anaerotignum propionicum]|uniref:class II D-tagatose-bisphosphate aldolase, non-catalytic subunit n=1 Tax=Anaerotignum propionicum TaxID=28446 RepID=UPI00210CB711|nr:class II D-tagatose-bisphosphate aldolase, non-catalytic subunit [Anaerotignum propionicum]MCQ4937221.1 class II D-tagatose-bisphosphate aldolase, non-catalytic subunit [Anaerotignum propionicum]